MNWNAVTIAVVACLVVWRCVWLASGVPDTTASADAVREEIQRRLGLDTDWVIHADGDANAPPEQWRVSFEHVESNNQPLRLTDAGIDVWDNTLPIWITPGRDAHPGWAGWDDNGDGTIDDSGELGAAWSDDRCVVQMPSEKSPGGRVIDHGGFRRMHPGDNLNIARHHFQLRYIRDAP